MAKILLVEDDNNLREIYEARLQAEGYTIVSAMDGEEALVVAKKEKPDLVISDVMMPRISGFEMLDILRNTDGLKEVKVIMLTALGQAEDKTRADALGADRYLVKSQVTLEDIVKAAQELLGPADGGATVAPGSAMPTPTPAPTPPAPAPSTPVPTAPAPLPTPSAPMPTMPAPSIPVATPPVPTPEPSAPAPSVPAATPSPAPEPSVTPAPSVPVPTPPAPAQAPAPSMPTPSAPAPVTSPVAPTAPDVPPVMPSTPPTAPTMPEPVTPAPTPTPAPEVPSLMPAPAEPTEPAPAAPATVPEAPAPEAVPAPEQPAAQSASTEEEAIKAQIEDFVNQNSQTAPGAAPAAPTPTPEVTPTPAPTADTSTPAPVVTPTAPPAAPAPATPQASDDNLMANAVKSLVSDDDEDDSIKAAAPAGERNIAPLTQTPEAPVPPAAPAPTDGAPAAESTADSDNDEVTVAHKKIITPITDGSAPHRPDLNELLAKEGFTPDDIHNGQTNPQTGLPPAPHPPGHVISPNAGNDPAAGVDPNSIAL
jgi:CheY-like chemotaxis protein